MIPYSYEMVDMGGIDLAEANGTVVEGIYNRIIEAVNACGDAIFYNWKFADIEIAPASVNTLEVDSSIIINGMIQVTEQDEITVLGIDPPPPPILPVTPLSVVENGVYEISPPQSGYNPVTVQVPPPVITPLSVDSNGVYTVPAGVDGYSPITVSVVGYEVEWIPINSKGQVNYGSNIFDILCLPNYGPSISTFMNGGWNASGSAYYNTESLIGAFAGFYAAESVRLNTVRVYIGRYSAQNKELTVTFEYMNLNSDWVEIEDVYVSATTPYPVNYFDVDVSELNLKGFRWIHKKGPVKTSGNNIVFFGFTLLGGN